MRESIWSSSACSNGDAPFPTQPAATIVDTVENVFVQSPMAGTWTVQVIAEELVADARLETPGVNDVDFALVVSYDMDCDPVGISGPNGRSDADDILDPPVGVSMCDCNYNGIPDRCESGLPPCGCSVITDEGCPEPP